jgi:NAD(P)-dependent dehydrogenase (short-subunit alcohol dehydrogenase family)
VIAAYATGALGLMRNLALDLRPIRVNIIEPGAVDTELWDDMPREQYEGFKEIIEKGSTTGRIGSPQDVAEAYLYVMKDSNCSGSVVRTDGGSLIM